VLSSSLSYRPAFIAVAPAEEVLSRCDRYAADRWRRAYAASVNLPIVLIFRNV